jgi:phosphoribosyl 1,2-cyclic phosphodiesterase
MKVTTYGTRGSVPIAKSDATRYGGNTTCLRIESDCLPNDHALVVDAGSGIVPLGHDLIRENITDVSLLFTHYHHDHTQGLFLFPLTFMPNVQKYMVGPIESEVGPIQMLKTLMKPPFFPLSSAEVQHHFNGKGIEHPNSMVIIMHPVGGLKLCKVNELCAFENASPAQVPMGKGKFDLVECLVIKMLYSNHPERTVSYRFEERPTGKVFVFLTDHENQDAMPTALKKHLADADLLIMDSQYTPKSYHEGGKAGYGHGTPDYCVRTAQSVGAKRLGLTHHDPSSSDEQVDDILAIAKNESLRIGFGGEVVACADYGVLDVA